MIRELIAHRENWDSVAVIDGDKRVSYRELARKARAIQGLLTQGRRENIAILLPNGGDYIAAFYGIVMSGMTAFPLSPMMTSHEILPLLAQATVRTVITAQPYRSVFEGAHGLRAVIMEELPDCDDDEPPAAWKTAADEPMVLLGTSGTTGRSKIVQLSENNVAASVAGYMDKMDFIEGEDARFILGVPFSSAYGLMVICVCLIKSYPVVLMPGSVTLDAFYKAVQDHRATHYEGGTSVILMMEQLAGRPIPYDISSLRYLAFGGSKVSGSTIRKLRAAYPGVEFYQGYGMTEASPLITKKPIKPDSVGTAITGVKIAVEAEGRITDAPHIRGEILVKGPNIMLGYYENREETDKVLKDGYLHTGDIGYLDEDGDLYICGRKKNIIIVRGFNVHPEEVEECVANSGLVKDCLVYGREDGQGGEVVCAEVVPVREGVTARQIMAHCRAHLAGFKQPERIYIRQEIRKNTSGKTERVRGGKS